MTKCRNVIDQKQSVSIVVTILLLMQSVVYANELNLQQYKGRVVVVDFWASWCVPCRQSFPWLNQMQQKYGDSGLVIIGVNVDRERAEANRFLTEVPASFNSVYDPEGKLATEYQLLGMPTSLVFDSNGKLVETHVGFKLAERDNREAAIKQLLQKPVKH